MNFEELEAKYDINNKTCIVIFSKNDNKINKFINNKDTFELLNNVNIHEHIFTKRWVPDLRVFFVVQNNDENNINNIITLLKNEGYITFNSFRHKITKISLYIFGELHTKSNMSNTHLNHFPSDDDNSYIIYEKESLKNISEMLTGYNIEYKWDTCSKIKDVVLTKQYLQKSWYLGNPEIDNTSNTCPDLLNINKAWIKMKPYTLNKKGSPNVKVAIYDDGFDLSNISLYHNKNIVIMDECNFHNEIKSKYNRVDNNPTARPYDTHGTPVASLCLGNYSNKGTIGIAPDVTFVPMAIRYYHIDENTNKKVSNQVSSKELQHYFNKEITDKVDIISCSWVFFFKASESVIDYIDSISNETTFIAAAGNYGQNITHETYGFYELGNKNIILVGSVDKYGLPTSYTNFGKQVNIYAPAGVLTKGNNYSAATLPQDRTNLGINNFDEYLRKNKIHYTRTANTSGTSFSTPIVSGVIALMKSILPSLKSNVIRKILQKTGTPMKQIYDDYKKSDSELIKRIEEQRKKFTKTYNSLDEFFNNSLDPVVINAEKAIDHVIKIKLALTSNMSPVRIMNIQNGETDFEEDKGYIIEVYLEGNNEMKKIRTITNAKISETHKINIKSKKKCNVTFTFKWINKNHYRNITCGYDITPGNHTINHNFI